MITFLIIAILMALGILIIPFAFLFIDIFGLKKRVGKLEGIIQIMNSDTWKKLYKYRQGNNNE